MLILKKPGFLINERSYITIAGAIMSTIYDEKKDDDGFLYVTYSGENTFGSIPNLSMGII